MRARLQIRVSGWVGGRVSGRVEWAGWPADARAAHSVDGRQHSRCAAPAPDDMPAAKQAIDLTVRFLTIDGDYEPIGLTISLVELETARAALLVVPTVP